ncbi:MAG: ATP-binding protein [Pirellulaceae bacterium]
MTSRRMDFLNRKELTAQTGHDLNEWIIAILKELLDNALDACEEAGTPPVIKVRVDEHGVSVSDNGPGIPADVVRSVLDFNTRTSSREAYVAPDRGAQGNALKTLIAMPFVLDGEVGRVTISAHEVRHEITLRIDAIRQMPVIDHDPQPDPSANCGTKIFLAWPNYSDAKETADDDI